jgi:hypothetical protein
VLNNPLKYVDPSGHDPQAKLKEPEDPFPERRPVYPLGSFGTWAEWFMASSKWQFYEEGDAAQSVFVSPMESLNHRLNQVGAAAGVLVGSAIYLLERPGAGLSAATAKLEEVAPGTLEGAAVVPSVGPTASESLLFLARANAAMRLSNAAMRLDYLVLRGSETVLEGTIYSGRGGDWGHAEMRFLDQYFDFLQAGDTVILQGENALCGRGLCNGALNMTSLALDVDILYYGYTPYPSLTWFAAGEGHVPARLGALGP